MQRDLEFAYDRELRTQRMAAYKSLYTKTESLPRYWRQRPRKLELPTWSQSFHEWYFLEAGGLFLSDEARQPYHDALNVIAVTASQGSLRTSCPKPRRRVFGRPDKHFGGNSPRISAQLKPLGS
jgi:hypothetical protein